MSKHNTNAVKSEVVESVEKEVVEFTFADAIAAVPLKEHRTFVESDFDAVKALTVPETAKEVMDLVKPLGAAKTFAFCVVIGKTGCVAIAKKMLADGGPTLKASAVASFKSVEASKTEFFAGKTAYGLISAVK